MGDGSRAILLAQIQSQTDRSVTHIAQLEQVSSRITELGKLFPDGQKDPRIDDLNSMVEKGTRLIDNLKQAQTNLEQLVQQSEASESPDVLLPSINKEIEHQNSLLEQLVDIIENISKLQNEITEERAGKQGISEGVVNTTLLVCYVVVLVKVCNRKIQTRSIQSSYNYLHFSPPF